MRGQLGNERFQESIRAEAAAVAYAQTHPTSRTASTTAPAQQRESAAPDGHVPVIVVGVDGTDDCDAAALWAAREAKARQGHLVLVAVDETYGALPPTLAVEQQLRRHLDTVEARLKGLGLSADDVASEVLPGTAGPALVERARHADLLVVGSRRRKHVTRALLGSVSSHCVAHAACPTTVVPTGWTPSE